MELKLHHIQSRPGYAAFVKHKNSGGRDDPIPGLRSLAAELVATVGFD